MESAQAVTGDAVQNATDLYDIYNRGYGFPKWSLDMLKRDELPLKETVVYFSKANVEHVRKIVTQREPVNIAMNRLFDQSKLLKRFKYSVAAYAEWSNGTLPPNVAIYCKTPVQYRGQICNVHVINLIGYAFDAEDQVDYKYFFGNEGRLSETKKQELVAAMQTMWRYAFECAVHKNLKYLYLADVGGGAFSTLLRGGYDELKKLSLDPIKKEFKDRVTVKQLDRIPDMVFHDSFKNERDQSLLVNAWDPFSMVGNGNENDNSLDGYWGRCSAMAVLCWPPSNPHIRYVDIATLGPKPQPQPTSEYSNTNRHMDQSVQPNDVEDQNVPLMSSERSRTSSRGPCGLPWPSSCKLCSFCSIQ